MRTVFVIDDDQLMREVISRQIGKSNYRVRSFASPGHALPFIDSQYPDGIVSDVQMPGMTGIELAKLVRERAPLTPVILMTAASDAALLAEAERAGLKDVFEKPLRDARELVDALDRAIGRRQEEERNAGLDGLRMSFLSGLAHELRTPLTAIKLALENLFASRAGGQRSTEERLLAISQRNIDRIVCLVERQLDLLQITLGDVSVARRLVSVRDLVESVVAESPPSLRKRVRVLQTGFEDCPMCFTDPDRLRTVVRYLMETVPRDEDEFHSIEYESTADGEKIELRFLRPKGDFISAAGANPPAAGRMDAIPDADTFEHRAFTRIVASLGGGIRHEERESESMLAVSIPSLPRFDAREDCEATVSCLREAAMLSGRSLSSLKCRLPEEASGGARMSEVEKDFFSRCRSALSEGDALVRGLSPGTYQLLLVERRSDEIDHVAEFLRAPHPSGVAAEVEVENGICAQPLDSRATSRTGALSKKPSEAPSPGSPQHDAALPPDLLSSECTKAS